MDVTGVQNGEGQKYGRQQENAVGYRGVQGEIVEHLDAALW